MSSPDQSGSIKPRRLGGVYLSPEEIQRNRSMFLEHDRIFQKLKIVPYIGDWDWRHAPATPFLKVDLTNHIKNQDNCNRPDGVNVGGAVTCNSSNCNQGLQPNNDVYPCSCFATVAAIESSSVVQQGKANWSPNNVPDLSDYFLYYNGGIDDFIKKNPLDAFYQSGVMNKVFDFSSSTGVLPETNTEKGGWWCPFTKLDRSFDPYANPPSPPVRPIEFMGTSSIHWAKYYLRNFGPLVTVGIVYWSLFLFGNIEQYRYKENEPGFLYSHHEFAYGGYPGTYDGSLDSETKMGLGHAMTVVGFKDINPPIVGQYFDSAPNPNPVTVTGYWRVRNSWGKDWGDNGYCYLPYGTVNINGTIEPYSECDIGSVFPFFVPVFTPFQMHRQLLPILILAENSKISIIGDEEMSLESYLNKLLSGEIPKPFPNIAQK